MVVASNSTQPINLAPGVVLAGFNAMLDPATMGEVKVVVNCGNTPDFLRFLDTCEPVIPSNVLVLNLDPHTSLDDEAYREFHVRFNRVLQNYLAFFYSYNKDVHFFVNSNYQNNQLRFDSPTMNGVPLKLLFNINRLLKLIKNVNGSANFLFVSEHYGLNNASNALLYSLAILYLMDNYNYNFDASCRFLLALMPLLLAIDPGSPLFNANHYDDVLLIDSLKKFFVENAKIKQAESGVMTKNFKLKRSMDMADTGPAMQSVKRMA